jgi:hypothetical protein
MRIPPTVFRVDLRARRATCAGAPPGFLSIGVEDPALGARAIAGPAPAGAQANDGEPPIQLNGMTPPAIAGLVRLYQPTLEVTATDRFWPVSVGGLLADVGANGSRRASCTADAAGASPRPRSPASTRLAAPAATTCASRPPRARSSQPVPGLRARPVRPDRIAPRLDGRSGPLDPWYSAQIYFFYASVVDPTRWKGSPPGSSTG